MSLSERTRTGLREMPSNAAWLLSRALKPAEALGDAAESTTAQVRDRGRKVTAAVLDATPVGGDSVDVRLRRAREAAERAREAEEQAVAAAQESKERADNARRVNERGRARLADVERESARRVKQRVADAEKAAAEAVSRERQEARADAEAEQQAVQAEVDAERDDAEHEAETSRARAEELVTEATERLAEARRLADEATGAARAAAEEAHRQAQELADEAEQQAGETDARIEAAEHLRRTSEATVKPVARPPERQPANGQLETYSQPELIELASTIGIEGRATMTKNELIDAIKKSRAER